MLGNVGFAFPEVQSIPIIDDVTQIVDLDNDNDWLEFYLVDEEDEEQEQEPAPMVESSDSSESKRKNRKTFNI